MSSTTCDAHARPLLRLVPRQQPIALTVPKRTREAFGGSDLKIQHDLRIFTPRAAVAVFQLWRLGDNLVVRRGAGGDEDVAADDRAFANHGVAAEDGGAGVDRDVVLDRRVARLAPQVLAVSGGEGAQSHALVDLDVGADARGLANDDARAVVDEQAAAELGAWVDVDARRAVRGLGHD